MDEKKVECILEKAAKGRWTVINLNGLGLSSIPDKVYNLSKLRILHLRGNSLTTIHPSIGELKNLKELDLSYNLISELPEEIGHLQKLQSLNLESNNIVNLPKSIGKLIRLSDCNLRNNHIQHFPSSFGDLKKIKLLDLSKNKIEEIPKVIYSLTRLKKLYLDHNNLKSLDREMANLERLKYLGIYDNPIEYPPNEILRLGTVSILEFLLDMLIHTSERFEAKVLLLGQGGVGKTSTLRSLMGLKFTDSLSTTRGVDVNTLEFMHHEREDVTLKLNVWDFAGQEIEHATHQFFMSSKSVYLLVWNARHGYVQARLDYWLEMIKSRAPGAPIILIATQIDERLPDINFVALKKTYPQLIGQCHIDNKTGTGIKELNQFLVQTAANLPSVGQPWPHNWQVIEDDLNKITDYYIDYSDFSQICKNRNIKDDTVSTVSEALHNLGVILHFNTDPILREIVILKPNWITKAMSFALTDNQIAKAYGLFKHELLAKVWEKYPSELYSPFFSLMNKFELCYQIEGEENLSLIPALLPYEPLYKSEFQPKLRMIYRLSSVPPGLMSRFIVRTHRFTQNKHWREGVLLFYDGQEAIAELFEHPREFYLSVNGSSPTNFFAILTDTLDQIIGSFPGLGVEKRVPCSCSTSSKDSERCSYTFRYDDLVRRREKGKDFIECNQSLEEVSLRDLLFGIHESSNQIVREKVEKVPKFEKNHRQLILLGQRAIIQNYHQLTVKDTICPNIFLASEIIKVNYLPPPQKRQSKKKRHLTSQSITKEIELKLLCQSADGWHFASKSATYNIKDTEKNRKIIVPLLLETKPLLPHVIPKSGLNIDLTTVFPDHLKMEINKSIKYIDEVIASTCVERGGQESLRVSLREFFYLVKSIDDDECYGNLSITTLPDGTQRWLCPFHQAQYQSTTLQISKPNFDTFLCHNSKDKDFVREVAKSLSNSGISCWLDEEQILCGDRWQDMMAKGLQESSNTIIFISENGWGDWQIEEMQVALSRASGGKQHRVIPLLIPPLKKIPNEMPAFLKTRHALALKSQQLDNNELDLLIRSILENRNNAGTEDA